MKEQIRQRMFTIPVTVFKQSPPSSTHETRDINIISMRGYVYRSTKVVISKHGREEISDMQIYLYGTDVTKVWVDDLVSCLDKIKQEPLRIDVYYKPSKVPGVAAKVELGVIYLQ